MTLELFEEILRNRDNPKSAHYYRWHFLQPTETPLHGAANSTGVLAFQISPSYTQANSSFGALVHFRRMAKKEAGLTFAMLLPQEESLPKSRSFNLLGKWLIGVDVPCTKDPQDIMTSRRAIHVYYKQPWSRVTPLKIPTSNVESQ